MARPVMHGDALVLLADAPAERELLRHCRRRDGELTLDGAIFPVVGDVVALPEGVSQARAAHLAQLLELAGEAHARALARRSKLRLT